MLRAVVLLLASSSASALLNLGAARAPTNKVSLILVRLAAITKLRGKFRCLVFG